MKVIKLSAIDSTNVFLKDLSKKNELENFTVAIADEQLAGKGQVNTTWCSEKGKNLLFTIYVNLKGLPVGFAPYINFLVAEIIRKSIINFLNEDFKIKIKWPNDIMSYNKKIAGILVENIIKNKEIESCFIGVGLNVNQSVFPDYLPKADSLYNISGNKIDKEALFFNIISDLKKVMLSEYLLNNLDYIKSEYLSSLYKINTPAMFQDMEENSFMGKIIDVTNSGLLLLEKENEKQYSYAVKEIRLL